MSTYRLGDEVRFEVVAKVEGAEDDMVLIQFDDTKMYVVPKALTMVRRSIHETDRVLHQNRKARVIEQLEEGVFLVRITGQIGVDGYVVASRDDLEHDDTGPTPAAVAAPIPSESARQPAPASTPGVDAPATVEPGQDVVNEPVKTAPRVEDNHAEPARGEAPAEPRKAEGMQPAVTDVASAAEHRTPPESQTSDRINDEEVHVEEPSSEDGGDQQERPSVASAPVEQTHPERMPESSQGDSVAEMGTALASLIRRKPNLEMLGETETIRIVPLDGARPEEPAPE